jgi:hypothetical protein
MSKADFDLRNYSTIPDAFQECSCSIYAQHLDDRAKDCPITAFGGIPLKVV